MNAFATARKAALITALTLAADGMYAGDAAPLDDEAGPPFDRNAPWTLSDAAIARELANPATTLLRVENRFAYRGYQGDLPRAGDGDQWSYELTPVYPILLDSGRILELRMTIPIVFSDYAWDVWYDDPIWELDRGYAEWLLRQSPQVTPSTGRFRDAHGHLDDVRFEANYGGVNAGGVIGMLGLVASFPSSTDITSSRDQALLGPQAVLGRRHDRGVYGLRLKHLVAVAGDHRYDVNETWLEPFFAWQLGDGWQVISNPSILYDWEGDSGNRLLLPIGGGVSKTTRIGRVPLKLDAEIYYYAETTERFGTEWLFSIRVTPVVWNPWAD